MSRKDYLILEWEKGEIHTSVWFRARSISRPLVHKYLASGLLQKLGGGAYAKTGDKLDWQAAIYAAQSELNLPLHVGGRSALELMGVGQYLPISDRPSVIVVATKKCRVPIWMQKNDWGVDFQIKSSSLFGDDTGIEVFHKTKFAFKFASRERAIIEVINTVDLRHSFEEIEQYIENLLNIRSGLTQKLLEQCTSIKTKRVFLYVARKKNLPVLKKLDFNKINLGSGDRVVALNGKLNKEFSITVPSE